MPVLLPALPEHFLLPAFLFAQRRLLRFQRFHGGERGVFKCLLQKAGCFLIIANFAAMGGAKRRFVLCLKKLLICLLPGKINTHVVDLRIDRRQLRAGFPQGCGSGAITRLRCFIICVERIQRVNALLLDKGDRPRHFLKVGNLYLSRIGTALLRLHAVLQVHHQPQV